MRGGHQVTWAIDGVPIPNTNIASNVGPQIDPKDIDYLEAQRGGYSAGTATGRTACSTWSREPDSSGTTKANCSPLSARSHQTNDQVNFGGHTEKLRLVRQRQRQPQRLWPGNSRPGCAARPGLGSGGMGSLIYNPDAEQPISAWSHPCGATIIRSPTIRMPRRRVCATWSASAMRWPLHLGAHVPAGPAAHGLAVLSLQPRQLRRRPERYAGQHDAASRFALRRRANRAQRGDGAPQRDRGDCTASASATTKRSS